MFDDVILHELKNPLSGITTATGLFLDGLLGEVSPEQKKFIENIDLGARRLTTILSELTFLNKLEKQNYRPAKVPFPAAELSRDLEWLKRTAARENKAITENIDPQLLLLGDRALILLVVTELLLNALRQTSPGAAAVEFKIGPERDNSLIEVNNSGTGVPEDYLPKIFDRDFLAANPQFKGMTNPSPGLYFCKQAVESQGGQIGVERRAGLGSRFYFTLPKK
jgi:signal transduction histidine kinase